MVAVTAPPLLRMVELEKVQWSGSVRDATPLVGISLTASLRVLSM